MNFDFTADQKKRLDAIRSTATTLLPESSQISESPGVARKTLGEVVRKLAGVGYLSLGTRENSRGEAVGLMAAMEILAGCAPGFFLSVEMSTRVLGRALVHWGTGREPQAWLQSLWRGEWIGALALSEETLNVENDPLTTTGTRQGQDILINGSKNFVINGPLADRIGVVGRLDGRTAIFVLDRQARGLTIADRISTMGYGGVHIAGITLRDCRLSKEHLLLPPEGTPVLDMLRAWENEVLLAAALGMMRASFEEARDFAKSHRTGGKPIIAYQEVGFKLSEMLTLYQTAQLLAYRAVWTLENDPKQGDSLLWCAKVFGTEAAERVAGDALRILAGQGYRSGSASETAYRAAKWTQIAGLSTEIARVRIGDHALGYR